MVTASGNVRLRRFPFALARQFILLWLAICWYTQAAGAAEAIHDLRNMDFAGGQIARLNGAWDYWPGQILAPVDLGAAPQQLNDPNSLVRQSYFFGRHDVVATLRTFVDLPEGGPHLSLFIPLAMPMRVLIDGKVVTSTGTPGAMVDQKATRGRATVDLPNGGRHEIVYQLSNHYYARFSLVLPWIGTANGISDAQMVQRIQNWILVGIGLTVALVTLLLTLTGPDRLSSAMVCAMAVGAMVEDVNNGLLIFPTIFFHQSQEDLGVYLFLARIPLFTVPPLIAFRLFEGSMRHWLTLPMVILGVVTAFSGSYTDDFTLFNVTYTAWVLIFVGWTLRCAVTHWRTDRRIKAFVMIVLPVFAVSLIEAYLGTRFVGYYRFFYFGSLAVATFYIYTIVDHLILARREAIGLATALRRTNEGLEKTIEDRTRDLRDTLSKQTANSEILSVISQSRRDASAVFNAITASAVKLCDAKVGGFFIYKDGYFESVSHSGFVVALDIFERFKPFPGSELERLPETKLPIQIPDLRETDAYRQRFPSMIYGVEVIGTRTLLWVPLLKDGELFGIMNVGRNRVEPFDQAQIETLQGFAAQAVIAIENARVLRELEERTQELEVNNAALRETQSQLVQAEKMASLGTLVAGVAHEINTPLGIAVTATTQVMADRDNLESAFDSNKITRNALSDFLGSARQGLSIAFTNLSRAAELVISFKQVAVDQHSEDARLIQLSAYIDDILTSLRPITRQSGVHVINDVPVDITATLPPGALAQILTNLIQNATIHAFRGGKDPQITVSGTASDHKIILTVVDNGIGMTEDVRAKAFDPFFTTNRGEGGGTGLGLHIVHNLVTEALKGSVELKSVPGQGTEFIFTLNRSLAAS
jgi:signal transduction histidine kinase